MFQALIFFFSYTGTPEMYTLSLHDALPILVREQHELAVREAGVPARVGEQHQREQRSEEHTSELQSHVKLVCRLLLEKKSFDFTSLSSAMECLWLCVANHECSVDGRVDHVE